MIESQGKNKLYNVIYTKMKPRKIKRKKKSSYYYFG